MGGDAALFKECEISFSAAPSGRIALDLALRLDMEALAAAGMSQAVDGDSSYAVLAYSLMNILPDFRLTCHAETDGKTTAETMELHIKNQCRIALESAGTVTETDDLPMAQPPEGALILED